MTVSENQLGMSRHRNTTQKLNFLESIFYPFLLVNFAVAIKFLKWKEDRYSSFTANVTSWQFLFFSASIAIWTFPAIKTKGDIYWIFSTLGFLAFTSLFGMSKWLQSVIYKAKLGSKISRKKNLDLLQTAGLIMLIIFFLAYFISVVLKAYFYHTRFFWWNH